MMDKMIADEAQGISRGIIVARIARRGRDGSRGQSWKSSAARSAISATSANASVAAARELFRTKGFEQTTTSEIAERADVGKGTLFFPRAI